MCVCVHTCVRGAGQPHARGSVTLCYYLIPRTSAALPSRLRDSGRATSAAAAACQAPSGHVTRVTSDGRTVLAPTGRAGEACPRILSPSQPGRAPAGGAGGAGTPASASVLHPGCWVPAPAAPAPSPAAAGSALGPLGPSGPVGPAAGPRAAARPPRPGPATAGPGPAPALPSGPGGERGRLTAVHSPLGPMCLCPALSWPTGLCWGAGPSPGVMSGPQPRLGHGPPDGPPGWGHVGFNGTSFLLGRIGRLTG